MTRGEAGDADRGGRFMTPGGVGLHYNARSTASRCVAGLYAAGDVVRGLDQIGAAMGQAGIAATAMRNALCEARPLRREGTLNPPAWERRSSRRG